VACAIGTTPEATAAADHLTSVVSIQGCQSRTVRDTAVFVDQCRGGAPGEFMPYVPGYGAVIAPFVRQRDAQAPGIALDQRGVGLGRGPVSRPTART
jgi:hypothetical protein